MKKIVKQNDEKEKQYLDTIGGDWVWSNDINIRAEDIQSAHESILCSEASFAHKGIANILVFLVTFFSKKSNIIIY